VETSSLVIAGGMLIIDFQNSFNFEHFGGPEITKSEKNFNESFIV
jgi:hypothetical protein